VRRRGNEQSAQRRHRHLGSVSPSAERCLTFAVPVWDRRTERPRSGPCPKKDKALVRDYDLMGVVNPEAKGRNLTLMWTSGVRMSDFTNPEVDRVLMTCMRD
jgi:hypothetical protein